MEGPKKTLPLYVGVFASDPKEAAKTVRAVCKEAILDVLKTVKPEGYLAEGEDHLPKGEPAH